MIQPPFEYQPVELDFLVSLESASFLADILSSHLEALLGSHSLHLDSSVGTWSLGLTSRALTHCDGPAAYSTCRAWHAAGLCARLGKDPRRQSDPLKFTSRFESASQLATCDNTIPQSLCLLPIYHHHHHHHPHPLLPSPTNTSDTSHKPTYYFA
jgi:hypothetical protein